MTVSPPPRSQRPRAAGAVDLAPIVGANLRRLRARHQLSLERLARESGVSRAMLSQIELGQSSPTVNVLGKIALALDVSFGALLAPPGAGGTQVLHAATARRLTSPDGRFASRALFPAHAPRRVELYELRLAAGKTEEAERHPPGTRHNLVVTLGAVEVRVGREGHHLATGDAIYFDADEAHAYRNPGVVEAVIHLVRIYGEDIE